MFHYNFLQLEYKPCKRASNWASLGFKWALPFFLGGRAKCLSGWFMALIYFQTKKVSQSAHLFEHGGGGHIAIWEMPVGILISLIGASLTPQCPTNYQLTCNTKAKCNLKMQLTPHRPPPACNCIDAKDVAPMWKFYTERCSIKCCS